MTSEQLERWKDFSLRMAKSCYATNRRPYVWQIIENVEWFFDLLDDDDVPNIVDWDSEPYVCDMCSHHEEKWIPHYWSLPYDDEVPGVYEKAQGQWADPVRCCIRAGLDMASSPSAGVVGFTAGDIRRMYPEGVPAWVFPPGERLQYWLSGELNGTFEDLPDSAGVVL